MKINNKNINELKEINIHDFNIINLDYNLLLEKISMNIASNTYEKKDIELIFNNISFFSVQNAYFWEDNNRIDISDIWYSNDKREFKNLVEKFDSQNKNYISSKLKDNFLEICIQLLNGGEIIIVCEEIIINEI